MARLFNGTTDNILSSTPPVTVLPCTISLWGFATSSKIEVAYVIGDGTRQLAAIYTNNDTQVHAFNNDATLANDSIAGGFSTNTWFHAAGTFAAGVTTAYTNGVPGPPATSSISSPTPTQESTGVSVQRNSKWWAGNLAEVAVWSDVLTSAEIAALAGGISPLSIRPGILKIYRPLWGLHSPELDLTGGMNSGTLTGTAFAPHAPVKLFRARAKTSNTQATAQSLSTVSISPASVVNGIGATGTVTLASPAAVGGVVVTLSSNNAAAVVPASVTVLAGNTTATFAITTATVGVLTVATITGVSTTTQTATLTVTPTVAISGLSVSPTTVTNGVGATGTITLNAPAGGGAPGTTWNVTAVTGDMTSAIQAVVNGAASGDSIVFAAGTYHVTTVTMKSGIAYVSTNGAVIQGTTDSSPAFGINGSDSHDITIDGLTFTGTGVSPTNGVLDFSGGSSLSSCNRIIVRNCVFNNNGITSAWLKFSFIVNNDFNNVGTPGTGVYCFYADNTTLAGNVFTNCYQGFGGNFDGANANQGRNNLYAQNKGTGTTRIFMELIGNAQVAGSPETQNLIVQDNVATAWGAQPADGEQTAYSIVPDFGTGTIIRRNYGQGPNRGIGIEMSGVSAISDSNYIDSFGLGIIGYSSLDQITNNNIIHFTTQTSTYIQTNETVTGNTNNVSLPPPTWLGRWTGAVGTNSTVTLSSNNAAAVVPASATVLAGATTGTFAITTTTVSVATAATITGTLGGTATAILNVNPTEVLSSLSVSPTFISAGTSSLGTVVLTSPALTGGAVVTLSSGNAAAVVPASVTVAAGATTATFLISSTNVASNTAVTITAVFGATHTAVLTVEPATLTLAAISVSPTSVANGVSSVGTVTLSAVAPGAPGVPAWDHIIIVMEENHTFGEVIGNTANAPYINNTLVAGGALLTNYFAITHPSEPNYYALYAGDTFGVTDDLAHSEADPSIYTVLNAAGKTFVGYVESGSPSKHNPWESFPEGFSVEQDFAGLFPTNFDLLPDVAFVIPNQLDDMHDGTIAQGDSWLATHIDAYAQWALVHNSLLIVTWDEDDSSSTNKVPCILFGAHVVPGLYSTTYNHYSTLRTVCDSKGVTAPRNGATAVEFATATFGSGGSTAVPLTSNNPAAVVPGSALVASGATTGTFPITTTVVGTSTAVTIGGTFGGVPRTTTLTVTPTSVTLASVSIAPASVNNGIASTGTLTLSGPALTGGATVTLSSNNAAATVPASAFIAAGQTTVTFPIATGTVSTSTVVTVTAILGATFTATITVTPSVAMASLTVSPTPVPNGTPSTGTVTLTSAAPGTGDPEIIAPSAGNITDSHGNVFTFHGGTGPGLDLNGVVTGGTGTILGIHNDIVYTFSTDGVNWYFWNGTTWVWFGPVSPLVTAGAGVVVTLSSNNAAATVPATVTVAAGATVATFPIATHTVVLTTVVTISGSAGSVVKSGTLTVTPVGAVGGVSEYFITLPDGSVADVPPQLFVIDRSVQSVSLSPNSVLGGVGVIGTVTLVNPAPTGNIVVALASNSSFASVPPTVTVLAGATSATFAVTTLAVGVTTLASITATAPTTAAQTTTLTLTPTIVIALASLTVSPTSLVSGAGSTGTVTLTNPAAVGGASVVLSSGDASVTVPASVVVLAGALTATFAITTTPVPVTKTVSVTGNFGGTPQSANLTLTATVTLGSLAVAPALVFGGNGSTGTVTLTNPAVAGGAVVALSSNDTHAVVPASVTVAAGATTATFPITTLTIGASTAIVLSATFLGVTKTAGITVTPVIALASLVLTPSTVVSGATSTATVTLNSPAPVGGALVTLLSSDPATVVPPSILIVAGAINASFTINPEIVALATLVTISGTYAGVTQSAVLTLSAPVASPTVVTAASTLTAFEVPLKPTPQTFTITMNGALYNLTVRWNVPGDMWVLDIADSLATPLVNGIPLVTGTNLLEQYGYLGITGQLFVLTDHDPLAVPNFVNLGTLGHLYFVPNAT